MIFVVLYVRTVSDIIFHEKYNLNVICLLKMLSVILEAHFI